MYVYVCIYIYILNVHVLYTTWPLRGVKMFQATQNKTHTHTVVTVVFFSRTGRSLDKFHGFQLPSSKLT